MTVRLARLEARAALARAARMQRLTARQLDRAKRALDSLVSQLDLVDIDDELTERASELAEEQMLAATHAIHLAAALRLGTDETVLVAGDRSLLGAAAACQLALAIIS